MPISVPNPYTGKDEETCSVSFKAQQDLAGGVSSPQTEAEYGQSKLLGEWGVIKGKSFMGEIPDGTKVLAFTIKSGQRGYVYQKGGQLHNKKFLKTGKSFDVELTNPDYIDTLIKNPDYTFSIPQSVSAKPKAEPAKAFDLATMGHSYADKEVIAITEDGQNRIVYLRDIGYYEFQTKNDEFGDWQEGYAASSPTKAAAFGEGEGLVFFKPKDGKDEPEKVTPPEPVLAKEESVDLDWAQVNKDMATFTDLQVIAVNEKGNARLQWDGATKEILVQYVTNGSFQTVYKSKTTEGVLHNYSVAWKQTTKTGKVVKQEAKPHDIAAPTPAAPVQGGESVGSMSDEDVSAMFVKIKDDMAKEQGLNIKGANSDLDQQVYQAIGEKTGYTALEVKGKIDQYKAAGNKLSALKKKVLSGSKKVPDPKPNAVPTKVTTNLVEDAKKDVKATVAAAPKKFYSDEDISAQYIIAKDQIVAASNGKWTLYTKSDELDLEIAIQVGLKTGFNPLQQKQAIANYLNSGKKLSVLKKQLIKQGALDPKADTLKKSGSDKTADDKKKDVDAKADAGYTPTSTPTTGTPPIDTGKPMPKAAAKADAVAGDIDHIPQAKQIQVFTFFKNMGGKSYLSSGPGSNYDGFFELQKQFENDGFTLLQLIRIADAQSAKKANVANGHLFEKQVAEWLTTPSGVQHIKDHEKKQAEKITLAKKKADADAAAQKLQGNQPPLPADSAKFQEMTPSKAQAFQDQWLEDKPFGVGEKIGLRIYTGGEYRQMNGYLRGKQSSISENLQRAIEGAARGMRKSTEPMLLRRGTGKEQFGLSSLSEIWGITGKTFQDKGFLSTSAAGRSAFGGEVAMEIEAPIGTEMMWVDNFSKHQGENEMVVQKGSRYKVLNVRKDPSGSYVVRVRVVND